MVVGDGAGALLALVMIHTRSEFADGQRRDAGALLIQRELEVLRRVARGVSNREIAGELALAEKTVKTHLSNILQKLHLADRTQAALYPVREHLADAD